MFTNSLAKRRLRLSRASQSTQLARDLFTYCVPVIYCVPGKTIQAGPLMLNRLKLSMFLFIGARSNLIGRSICTTGILISLSR
jgi:hypothetical protein